MAEIGVAVEAIINSQCIPAAATLLLAVASLHDLAFRTVPNWISVCIAGLAELLAGSSGHMLACSTAGMAVFVAALVCWQRGWLGAGDAKLLAATAMLVPLGMIFRLLLDIALAGGALATVYLLLSQTMAPPVTARPHGLLARVWRAERFRIHRRGPLPYASAIAAGAALVMLGH
jgi:prepilin peptidase CpaA